MMKNYFAFSFAMLIYLSVYSNNISVSEVSKASTNTTQDYIMLQFTVSWENSWRDAENYDAAWIFIKYRLAGAGDAWSHATLNFINGAND